MGTVFGPNNLLFLYLESMGSLTEGAQVAHEVLIEVKGLDFNPLVL